MDIIYFNGEWLPKEQATVSIMDRGFLFGDGVYEVLPVYHHRIFRAEQHIERLYHSLVAIKLQITLTPADWPALLQELITRNAHLGPMQSLYLQITRGAAPIRHHAFPAEVHPTILVTSNRLVLRHREKLMQGMSAITVQDTRWQHCEIKSTSLLANVLLYQAAVERQCDEAILIRDGYALEGATSNLFIVKDQVIKTPPISHAILGGITRDLVLELANRHGHLHEEAPISTEALYAADEVWITSSTREIFPIIRVDQQQIGNGKPGPVWLKMIEHYRNFIKEL